MARYVLTKIDEITHSREYKPKLWQRTDKGLLVWTVEHILPQGSNIPNAWIEMISGGDREKAYNIHEKCVHSLGNLTLSGYNSQLYNASFDKKQSLQEKRRILGYEINIGYKNGLALNNLKFQVNGKSESLATIKEWNEGAIKARNDKLVDILLNLFAFDNDELHSLN